MRIYNYFNKIRNKLFTIFFIQVCLLLCIALSVSFYVSKNSNERNIELLNHQLSALANDDMQSIFDEVERVHSSIITSSNFSKLYSATNNASPLDMYLLSYNIEDLLSTPLAASQYLHSINYLTPSRDMLLSSIAGEISIDRRFDLANAPDWFQLHTKLLTTVGSLETSYIPPHKEILYQRGSDAANKTVVSIIRKTANFNTNYANKGLLFYNIALPVFSDLTKSLNLYENMENIILTSNGDVIFDSSNSLTNDPSVLTNLLACKKDGYLTLNGDSYMTLPMVLPETDWWIYSLIPKSAYTRERRYLLGCILLAGTLIITLGFFMTWLLSRQISLPIESLSAAIKQIQSGNLKHRSIIKSTDEIGELSQSFNVMLDKIDTLIEQEYLLTSRQKDAQLKALQAQINPHFLYNILQSIASIASLKNIPEITIMANSLGKIMRYSIKTEDNTTTLQDELNHVSHYLEIQKIRYREKLEYDIRTLAEYDNYPLLKLTLQPLVENSIMHGFCDTHNKLYILVHVYKQENFLVVQISDDGLGMNTAQLAQLKEDLINPENGYYTDEHPSIGIKNVYVRYQIYYNHTITLEIDSEIDVGTVVTLKLLLPQENNSFADN